MISNNKDLLNVINHFKTKMTDHIAEQGSNIDPFVLNLFTKTCKKIDKYTNTFNKDLNKKPLRKDLDFFYIIIGTYSPLANVSGEEIRKQIKGILKNE